MACLLAHGCQLELGVDESTGLNDYTNRIELVGDSTHEASYTCDFTDGCEIAWSFGEPQFDWFADCPSRYCEGLDVPAADESYMVELMLPTKTSRFFDLMTAVDGGIVNNSENKDVFFASESLSFGETSTMHLKKPKEASRLAVSLSLDVQHNINKGHEALVSFLESKENIGFREKLSKDLGARAYDIWFREQKLDYNDENTIRFSQRVILHHRGEGKTVVLRPSGYNLRNDVAEPTQLLGANEIQIENRFYGLSNEYLLNGEKTPFPKESWPNLTIENTAHDTHSIVELFKEFYTGPWIGFGASKGGENAIAHRRFYPNDTVATFAYATPIVLGFPDNRYVNFADTVLSKTCLNDIRDFQRQVLSPEFIDEILTRDKARQDVQRSTFEVFPNGHKTAFENAILWFGFGFFLQYGVDYCSDFDKSSQKNIDELDALVALYIDLDTDESRDTTFYYQVWNEGGYPKLATSHLDDLVSNPDRLDLDYYLPDGVTKPEYDGGSTNSDLLDWLEHDAEKVFFIDGEFDPWRYGAFDWKLNPNIFGVVVKNGNHSANLRELYFSDDESEHEKLSAFAKKLEEWTGLTL